MKQISITSVMTNFAALFKYSWKKIHLAMSSEQLKLFLSNEHINICLYVSVFISSLFRVQVGLFGFAVRNLGTIRDANVRLLEGRSCLVLS